MKDRIKLLLIIGSFLVVYFLPIGSSRFQMAILEAFHMLKDYAREHVLFCLVPAFFIAGAISVFIHQAAVMKYFGIQAKKWLSYSVASVSGTILAVCSCTVLPIFAGIYKRGAGIGPAITFLYSGPAINVLAIILTARVLGPGLGLGRAIGAVIFSIIIGLFMALIFQKEESGPNSQQPTSITMSAETDRPLWKNGLYFLSLVLILIFAAWGKPRESVGFWNAVYEVHWPITAALCIMLVLELESWVGGNSLRSNFLASIAGAFMYFATLTEVPILQGLVGAGMGNGPALALLLAGPALSIPNMLVIRSVIGTKKTITYIGLVVIMATLSGFIFGNIVQYQSQN